MNDKFDALAKGMAQSVTRRGVLKKFGGGLAAIVLASLGLPNQAEAGRVEHHCNCKKYICNCPRKDTSALRQIELVNHAKTNK